jgi:hypothetical protein
MVYFQTKNPNLGKFWRAFEWKMLVYNHLEYFTAIWYNSWPFGIVRTKKNLATLVWTSLENTANNLIQRWEKQFPTKLDFPERRLGLPPKAPSKQ